MWQNSKTQNVTKTIKKNAAKLKKSKCDKTQKHKMWHNSKTLDLAIIKNSKCDNSQKIKIWKNSKHTKCDNWTTQNVTKLKNSKCV